MDEAEQLCDRLVVMDKGKIVAEGSPRNLIAQYAPRGGRASVPRGDDGCDDRQARLAGREHGVFADRVIVYTDDAEATQHQLTERDIHPEQVLVRRSSLEDVFLKLTGRRLID